MTDRHTPRDPSDDKLARFSSTGPTYEGFVKPEIMAPGGHVQGMMPSDANIRVTHRTYEDGPTLFIMSGTSQPARAVLEAGCNRLQAAVF